MAMMMMMTVIKLSTYYDFLPHLMPISLHLFVCMYVSMYVCMYYYDDDDDDDDNDSSRC